jgi:predicted MFS family arabinose efflux permease
MGAMLGRVVGGYLMDKLHAPTVAAGFFLLATAALLLLVPTASISAKISLLLIGLCAGSEADVVSYLSSRYLKLPALGLANGLLIMVFTASNAAGVLLLGSLFDSSNTYTTGLLIAAVCALAAAVLITRLGPYRTR